MAALAGIGSMPDTIEDRAVVIRMRRKAPGEKAAPYRHRRDRPALQTLTERLSAWLRADLTTLEHAEPAMPVEDRAADTWEPLVVVADYAGGRWPDRARTAVLTLTAEAADHGQISTRVRLLADCRIVFGTDTALATAVLLDRLKADPDAPWLDYGPAGLTAAKLGALLREYDIRSANIRFPDGAQAKGYQRADFTDAWTRYCPVSDRPAEVAVPAVPRSSPQVQPGRLAAVGRLSRPDLPNRPALISTGTPGTAGTATPSIRSTEGVA
jgi:hypothetical protein